MARLPSPFDTLQGLQQALDSFRTSSWLDASPSGGGGFPPINVFRKGEDFALIAELPGVKKSDIEVQVKGRTVRISGGKAVEYPAGSAVHRRERLVGRFDRAISLPFEIDPERVQAESRDGVLALPIMGRLSADLEEKHEPRAVTLTPARQPSGKADDASH